MPPALAKDLAYSSLRNERHTPAPPAPPNGPSPSMPVIIWLNIELMNVASKSTALARALALASNAGIAPGAASGSTGLLPVAVSDCSIGRIFCGKPMSTFPENAPSEAPAVGPARAGMVAISHHLDIGLDGAIRLHGLQDGDHVEHPDAERVEAIDQLLQRHALVD